LALWSLRLDSELLFIGDAGTTEATRPTERKGAELGVYWFPNERYSANLDVSYTDVKFSDADPAGNRVPGGIPLVVGAGVTAHYASGWLASMTLRHFGRYPLIEDNSVQADGSTMVNLRLGREWKRWGVYLDVLNALDSRDHDVEYFYASRLPGEPAEGVEDSHFHIFPPRSLRASLRLSF
jgi:outer membrane receptor protein involved in Fe transport